jgi:hypothetical protein
MSLFPYDKSKMAVGPARVVYAPTSVAIPTKLQDILALNSPYKLAKEWVDFGSAPEGDAASYTRGFETEGLGIEQETSDIFTEIKGVKRSFKLTLAELDPTNISIVEGSDVSPEVIAKVKSAEGKEGSSAQHRVPLGSISELPTYRVAIIAQRKKSAAEVTEEDGTTKRGALVALVLNECSLAADDSEISVAKGSFLSAPITFEAFPDAEAEEGAEYGGHLFEDAGEIE